MKPTIYILQVFLSLTVLLAIGVWTMKVAQASFVSSSLIEDVIKR